MGEIVEQAALRVRRAGRAQTFAPDDMATGGSADACPYGRPLTRTARLAAVPDTVPFIASFRTRGAAAPGATTLLLAALAGCESTPVRPAEVTRSTQVPPVATAAPNASADDDVDRVLAVSIDGLNRRAITKLGLRGAPAFTD